MNFATATHEPPAYLGDEGAALWREVCGQFELEDHHRRLLAAACKCWDRAADARKILDDKGETTKDRFGVDRDRPEVAREIKYLKLYQSLQRELGLDVAPPPDANRAPRSGARYGSRA